MSEALPLPHDLDAERAVLSAILVRTDALDEALTHVSPGSFYDVRHGAVLQAVMDLDLEGGPIDAVAIVQHLRATGKAKGASELVSELLTYPLDAHVERQAERIAALHRQRRLLSALLVLVARGYQADPHQWTDEVERAVYELTERPENTEQLLFSEQLQQALNTIEERSKPDGNRGYWPTPWAAVNRYIHGLSPGLLYIVAATPGLGKTSMVLHLAWWLAGQQFGDEVLVSIFFELEMTHGEMSERALSQAAIVPNDALRLGQADDYWRDLVAAAEMLGKKPIIIDDTPGLSLLDIRARVRRYMAKLRKRYPDKKLRLAFVGVDHLQLTTGPGDTRNDQIAHVTGGLKKLAKDNDCAVVALSQLNRAQQKEKNRPPQLSDLRQSGAIEADADVVAFVYDPEAQKPEDRKPHTKIIFAKNRGGKTGWASLHYRGDCTLFTDYERDKDEGYYPGGGYDNE